MAATKNRPDPRRRVLLTALGTGRYEAVGYDVWGTEQPPTRYVQVALTRVEKPKSKIPLVVLVLVTDKAREVHWEALQAELEALEVEVHPVPIGTLDSPETFEDLRTSLRERLQVKDTVLLDITHGFRATAPLLIAAVEELDAAGHIEGIDRVTYGLYEKDADSSVWDLSHALTTRRLVQAQKSFLEQGDLVGLARVLFQRKADRGYLKSCKDWQLALDAHQLDALGARSEEVVRGLETWSDRTTDALAAPARSCVEAVVETLKPLAGQTVQKGAVERAHHDLEAARLALQLNRLAAAVFFAREAAISTFEAMVKDAWEDVPEATPKGWEDAFGLAAANLNDAADARTGDDADVRLYDRVADCRQDRPDFVEAAQDLGNIRQQRNPVAHCWRGHGGSAVVDKPLKTHLAKVEARLNALRRS